MGEGVPRNHLLLSQKVKGFIDSLIISKLFLVKSEQLERLTPTPPCYIYL